MTEELTKEDLVAYTTEIVSAYVSNNSLNQADIPGLINQTYTALCAVLTGQKSDANNRPEPVVPVNRSVKPDYIICLEDGKKLKMLKRHLMTAYNMTPEQYRERWNLPSDYPMVAPNYAKQRSELAKDIGLGRKGRGSSSVKALPAKRRAAAGGR